jgi:DNA-binding MarR family transcriptional regulator
MNLDAVDRILAQWQRERPDLDVSPMAIVGRITRLSKIFERTIQDRFMDFGLTAPDFDVLATLRRSGYPYQLNPTDLFNTLMVSSGTITHRIDRLEKSELVKRIPDPSDRRGCLISLTDRGFCLIEQVVEAHIDNEHQILKILEDQEKEVLTIILRKMLFTLEEGR